MSIESSGFVFTVGASRLPHLTGSQLQWEYPAAHAIIKEENKTVVWRQLSPYEKCVAKVYRQRGIWARFWGAILSSRVQREYTALSKLTHSAVPCSKPLLWGRGFSQRHGNFEVLATSEIANARTLKQSFSSRQTIFCAADFYPLFDTLRCMHECGVFHGALWPKNILMTQSAEGTRCFHLIDFARSVCFGKSILGTSMARNDVLSLLYSLVQSCAGFDVEAVLHRYGWRSADATRIAEQARRYRSSRHLRNRVALVVQARALWSMIKE